MAGSSRDPDSGRRKRRNAINRSANTGSMSSLRPPIWIKNDEWPMKVTPNSSGDTRMGFFDSPVIGLNAGLADECSQRLHFKQNRALALDHGFHCHSDYLIDSPARSARCHFRR